MICKDNVKNRTAAGNPVFYILSSLSYLLSLLFKKSGTFKEEPEDVWLVLTSSILNVSGIFVTFLGCIVSVAAVWLLLLLTLVLFMTAEFKKSDKTAALLQIPYILWLCFAGYLNLVIYLLNG